VSLFATLPVGPGPVGLAFDGSGNLYATDYGTDQISKITSGGAVSLFATLPVNSGPDGLAFDGRGNLYAADSSSGQISKISPDGLTVSPFATGISEPLFIAFAPVPEPSSAVLLAAAAGSLLLRRRRSRA
jgi:DNA-binding beta-propeller fold protein YncE